MSSRINDTTLRQIAAAMFGDKGLLFSESSPEDIFRDQAVRGTLTVPGGSGLVVISERFSILADLLKGRRSTLVKILDDLDDETILVVDSILSGAKALFFSRLCRDPEQIKAWMDCQQWPRWKGNIQPIDHEKVLIVSSAENFVIRSTETPL